MILRLKARAGARSVPGGSSSVGTAAGRAPAARGPVCLAVLAAALGGCGSAEPTASPTPALEGCARWDMGELAALPPLDRPWWGESVIYQIFVRSFYDTDADGHGDLTGVLQKLDYIQSLGADTLWLLPTFSSPSSHGYDVVDFETTMGTYGGDDAMDALIAAAHGRGMKIVLDLPVNHTSSQHPWFKAALDPESPQRGWYRFEPSLPEGSGWYSAGGGAYYAHFTSGMPDLNYDSPEVRAAMVEVMRGWMARGVDGFRLDAARYLVEDLDKTSEHPGTYCVLRGLRQALAQDDPELLLVGEVWTYASIIGGYLDDGEDESEQADLLPLAFDFPVAEGITLSLQKQSATNFNTALQERLESYPDPSMGVPFLSNHDQDRIASVVEADLTRLKLGAALLLSQPGPPVIYYGEEIGMTGVRAGDSDNPRRTPMQWNGEAPGYGFTEALAPWYPINEDAAQINVAAERGDSASLLEHYRRLIATRRATPALSLGGQEPIPLSRRDVVAFARRVEGQTVLVVAQFGTEEVGPVTLDLSGIWPAGGFTSALEIGGDFSLPDDAPQQSWEWPSLPPHSWFWVILE